MPTKTNPPGPSTGQNQLEGFAAMLARAAMRAGQLNPNQDNLEQTHVSQKSSDDSARFGSWSIRSWTFAQAALR